MINPSFFTAAAALEPELLIGLHQQVEGLMRREHGTAFASPGSSLYRLHTDSGSAVDYLRRVAEQVRLGQRPGSALEEARRTVAATLMSTLARVVAEMTPRARTAGGEFASDTQGLWQVERELGRLHDTAARAFAELSTRERAETAAPAQGADANADATSAVASPAAASPQSVGTDPARELTPVEQARQDELLGAVRAVVFALQGRLQVQDYRRVQPRLEQARDAIRAGDDTALTSALAGIGDDLAALPVHSRGVGVRELQALVALVEAPTAKRAPRSMPGVAQAMAAGRAKAGVGQSRGRAG